MQEQPYYIPPDAFSGYPPMYDPNGPIGQRVDAFSETRMTIGQLGTSEYPPFYGWTLGDGNTAYPAYGMPGEPPLAAKFAMMAAQYYAVEQYTVEQLNTNAEFMTALLLMML